MDRSLTTKGATTILVVLITLLLMAGILAASLRLSLGSRQNAADNAAALRAQYRAESGVALAQSRLRDIQGLLSSGAMQVPPTLSANTLQAYADQFCGGAPSWVPAPEFASARGGTDDALYENAQQCLVTDSTSVNQFDFLATMVRGLSYNALPPAERPLNTSLGAYRAFWNAALRGQQQVGDAGYELRALRMVKLDENTYRAYLGVAGLSARATDGAATRVLAGRRSQSGDWWVEVRLPSLLTEVLLTNHHRSRAAANSSVPNINFVNQDFDGPVHTNEKFRFTPQSQTTFRDTLTSAGCSNLPAVGAPSGGDCAPAAGLYIGTALQTSAASESGQIDADLNAALPSGVSLASPAQFTAPYRAFPTNANDQQADAADGGLMLDNAAGVDLYAGDSAGSPLSSYDADARKWAEPNPTYQYLSVYVRTQDYDQTVQDDASVYSGNIPTGPNATWNATPPGFRGTRVAPVCVGGGCNDYTFYWVNRAPSVIDPEQRYRYGADRLLQKFNPQTGAWDPQGQVFNGVLYSAGSLDKVTGPPRLDADTSGALASAPPAVASFAQLTLAAEGNVKISSDLTLSDTPCSFKERREETCNKPDHPQNVLGIYSQSGNILIAQQAPANLNIHAALLASSGEVGAEAYDSRPPSGNVRLIGSVIQNWYGAFGQVQGGTTVPLSGYGRSFSYDERLREGVTPPSFPVSPSWSVTDARGGGKRLDSLVWRQGRQ